MERERTEETSPPTKTKTDFLRNIVKAARRVDVPSLLLYANSFLLQQQRQLQPPYFAPASAEEDILQRQLMQCRETLLQLLQRSAAVAAAGAAVAAAIPGNIALEKDNRALIFNEATAGAWDRLLQDLRRILPLCKPLHQSEKVPLSEPAAAAIEELLEDLHTAVRYSRRRKGEYRRHLQALRQQNDGESPQGRQSWSQHKHMQQQRQQRQLLHLVQEELRALEYHVKGWHRPKGIDNKRSEGATYHGSAAVNGGALTTAANKATLLASHSQQSAEEESHSSSGSSSPSTSSDSSSSSEANSSDNKHSSRSSTSSKTSGRTDKSSKNSSSSSSSSKLSSSTSSDPNSSNSSSSSSSGSDSDSHAAVEPTVAPAAVKVSAALEPGATPVTPTVDAKGGQKRPVGDN